MRTSILLALGASLASLAVAVPVNHEKRRIIFTTITTEVVTTVWSTTTIFPDASSTPSSQVGIFAESLVSEPVLNSPSTTAAVSAAGAASPASSSAPAPAAAAPVATSSAAAAPAPASSTPAKASTPAAAASTVQAAASVAASPAAAAGSPVSKAGSSGNYPYTGEMTYYDVSIGLGSCGTQGDNSNDLVAIPFGVMANGINPNANPKCGKMIEISYNGATHTAKVHDTCPSCTGGSIDLTEELFKKIAPNGDGRVAGVAWRFLD